MGVEVEDGVEVVVVVVVEVEVGVEVEVRVGGLEVEVVLNPETTFSVWLGGWVAGEIGSKATSSSKFKLKLKLKMSLAK